MVHRDLHTGNILFFINNINIFSNNVLSISDMGLCGEVGNIDETKIYGVMPYVAPITLNSASCFIYKEFYYDNNSNKMYYCNYFN